MKLLLSDPLWLLLIALTVTVHVFFFVAVRRMMKRDPEQTERKKRSAPPANLDTRD